MTLTEFKELYPDVAVSDAQLQMYLDLFICQYGEDDGSCCVYDYMQGLFVAHRGTVMSRMGVNASPVMTATSKSVGSVSTSGTVSGLDNAFGDFGSTGYGIEFSSNIILLGSGPMMAQ